MVQRKRALPIGILCVGRCQGKIGQEIEEKKGTDRKGERKKGIIKGKTRKYDEDEKVEMKEKYQNTGMRGAREVRVTRGGTEIKRKTEKCGEEIIYKIRIRGREKTRNRRETQEKGRRETRI